jgi:DNA mismatch repair protein MutL
MNVSPEGGVKIKVLLPEVISRIAAGEVVERPAAVVKELLDNSIDAGSTRVHVDVTDGGRGMIRVTDDGEGMNREDAILAFERHATSKLRTEKDLWSVKTMGFRGEALPSIASVSRVRMRTARRDHASGWQLTLAGGTAMRVEETAAAPGTQIEVSDLFFNTPARKKFLKTTVTEFSHICQVVQQSALAWPETGFSLRHNGQEVFNYPAVPRFRDRVFQIYGPRCLDQMVEVNTEQQGLRIEGFTTAALHTRSSKSPQDLFVNLRPVRNATISHAIYEGYGAFLVKGRHPAFILRLNIDPDRVDVNVHPAKREVRFSDQEMVHRVVRTAVRDAIGESSPAPRTTPHGTWTTGVSSVLQESLLPTQNLGTEATASTVHAVHEAQPVYFPPTVDEVMPLGQIRRTFLVALVGSELQVIDQHTSHERVLFERLWRTWQKQQIVSQPLLIPEPIELPPNRAALLQRHLPDLETLGLHIEPFGLHSFVIRAVPTILKPLDYNGLVQDLLDDLSQWDSVASLDQRVRPVLASLACHGAVRAGRQMELPEMKQLIADWVEEGLPTTCPHGRRVALRFPEEELAKIFGRA